MMPRSNCENQYWQTTSKCFNIRERITHELGALSKVVALDKKAFDD
ncbi:Hypothetical Protein XCAW_04489 [Xanthomonas citri subsp. citri Aw12879]|nr:Hypothetical Protein XCAW_04489 [Xanthomonas citri subsp. citri Aw12879]